MKNLLLVFCLFISASSLAQRIKYNKAINVHSSNHIIPPDKEPLYIINGFIGSIREVAPDDIVSISISEPPGSVYLYGEQAKNGAVFITTKRHSKKKVLKRDSIMIDSLTKNVATYVIDGQISPNELDGIDPYEIVSINVLKDASPDPSMRAGENGVTILVVTKKYAVKSYHNRLSTLSKDYNSYLEKNKDDDSGLVYLLDGVVLEGKENEIIKKLYNVIEKVKTVDFVKKFSPALGANNPKPIIVITTRSKNDKLKD